MESESPPSLASCIRVSFASFVLAVPAVVDEARLAMLLGREMCHVWAGPPRLVEPLPFLPTFLIVYVFRRSSTTNRMCVCEILLAVGKHEMELSKTHACTFPYESRVACS